MRTARRISVLVLVGVGLTSFGVGQTPVASADKVMAALTTPVDSFAVDQLPVKKAFAKLFAHTGIKCRIDAGIDGIVTAHLHQVSREVILRALARQVDSTYRTDGDTVTIIGVTNGLDPKLGGQAPPSPSGKAKDAMANQMKKVDFDRMAVREAIGKVMSHSGLKVVIAPAITGDVTLYLRNVTRETALQNILRQIDATYSLRGDVLSISLRARDVAPVSPTSATDSNLRRRVFSYSGIPVRTVLKQVFGDAYTSYTVSPDVQGNVTVELDGKSLETALLEVLWQVHATCTVENGVYFIKPIPK